MFVAAPLPEDAAARVWAALADIRARNPAVRWVPAEKLHLTLVFLGSTDPARIESISAAVERVAQRHRPFEAQTGEAGGRVGGRRGGVAWLGLADGAHDVTQLALDLDAAIEVQTFDAGRPPRPHLTVARGVTPAALADLHTSVVGVTIGWTLDRIVLFRSHTDPRGSIYQALSPHVIAGVGGASAR